MSAPKNKKPRLEAVHLKIKEFQSQFQFVNEYFELMVWMQDEQEKMKTGGDDVPLNLALLFEDGSVAPDLLVVDPGTPPVIKNGRASLRVKVSDVSMNLGNRKFFILVSTSRHSSVSAKSDGIMVITHRLAVQPNPAWEDEWFKDEGGRDKCIELSVELQNAKGQRVASRRVPLVVTLLYHSGAEVSRQDILKLGPDSDLCIVEGKASIRARIDEVSRSHQNQAFTIRVGPDVGNNPLDNDVSPAVCRPVIVRSKRNNKKRKESAAAAAAAVSMASGPQALAAAAGSIARREYQAQTYGMPAGLAGSSSLPPTGARSYSSTSRTPMAMGVPEGDPNDMQQALTSVLGWISAVLSTLQKMRWMPLGVEHRLDGVTHDPQRILYQMQNPNSDIDQVLATYKNEVMNDLHVILGALEPMLQQQDTGGAQAATANFRPAQAAAAVDEADALPPIMPSLVRRQQSSAYIGDTTNGTSVPYVNNYMGPVSVQESGVHYIIGKMLVTQDLKFGFPAFNHGMQLVGFYKEADRADSEAGVASLSFIPLSHAKASASLKKENLQAAADSLEKEIKRKSDSVFKRSDFANLQEMKESAWFRYMSKITAQSAEDPWVLGEDFLEL